MESGGAQAPGERSGRRRLRLHSVRPPARFSLPILTGRRGNRATGAYPAAGLPVLAKESGSTLVILNREPTDLDGIADLVINREIGPTLGEAVNVN